MDHLTNSELQALVSKLHSLKEELERTMTLGEESIQPVDLDNPIGRVSRIDAYQQQQMAKANRAALAQRLALVKAAFERIEAGIYGECMECGEGISIKRLTAAPESLYCLDCQRGRER